MESLNENKDNTNILIEKVNQDHHIIYLSEHYKSNTQQQPIIISSKKIEFYILSSLSINFLKSTFLTIESCDLLIFHIKFREVTDLLNLNEITLLLTRINKINEVKHIELYINSTFCQNLEGNYINSYYSAREAASINNLFETNIRSACKINSKIKGKILKIL